MNGQQQSCGDGVVGNGLCQDASLCCSEWGYCGNTLQHCDPNKCWSGPGCSRRGAPCGNGVVGTGVCEELSHCCSESGYCDNTEAHCDVQTCWSGPGCPQDGVPCGDGIIGNGLCADSSLCCSKFGYCGSTVEHCDPSTCYSRPDNTCTREAAVQTPGTPPVPPSSNAPTSSPIDTTIGDDKAVSSAELVVGIEPRMQEILNSLQEDPTNKELLHELRELSALTWSSDAGLQLAQTLESSPTPDPTYMALRSSAEEALLVICEVIKTGRTLFSPAAADCICGNTQNPSTYCAASADRELYEYLNLPPNQRRRSLHPDTQKRQLYC